MCQQIVYLLVEVEVRFKVVDQCQHLFLLSECEEWNKPHEAL